MAGAANAAKGGFVREALVGAFPRLAALLEDTLAKLQRDTNVSYGSCAVLQETPCTVNALQRNGAGQRMSPRRPMRPCCCSQPCHCQNAKDAVMRVSLQFVMCTCSHMA